MITDDKGLGLALAQLGEVYRTIAALRLKHATASPQWLSVLTEGFLDHARQLQREIDEYTGVAIIEESRAEVWLRVEGRGVSEGVGPSSILTALLDAFRKGVQAVAEFLMAGKLGWRPTAALKAACDWRVVALAPGSLRIGISLPEYSTQAVLWEDGKKLDVQLAVREFVETAAWAASDYNPKKLAERFPDPDKRRLLLNAVKPFVPRSRGGVERVEVSGRTSLVAQPIVLDRSASHRIDLAIDQMISESTEDYTGDLREIDLDNLTMVVRNTGDVREVRCTFDESLLDAAKEALDRQVKVSGVRQTSTGRRSGSTLHVFRLEVLDDDTAEDESSAAPSDLGTAGSRSSSG
jgi:hypothetical protein